MTLLDTALNCLAAGITPVPIRPTGEKIPSVKWSAYQDSLATEHDVRRWFSSIDTDGVGIITGVGSGQLEMLEVEGRALDHATKIATALDEHGMSELWSRINNGWVEVSPSGGIHWHYRISDGTACGNTKLARRPATPEELADNPDEKLKVLVETRGKGGFTVIAPSAGRTHSSGNPWVTIKGGPADVPSITIAERDALYAIASMFDQMPAVQAPAPRTSTPRQPGDPLRPGDDFNQRATWDEILAPLGWTKARDFGRGCIGWTRPGKSPRDGISATTGRNDGDNLYVFTTSTEFESETPYSKFAAYTLLNHGNDWSTAAKALAADGYGESRPISPGDGFDLNQLVHSESNPTESAESPRASSATLSVVDGTSARVIQPLNAARVATAYGPTEDGIARALADAHRHDLRYCPQRGMWLTWTGSRWEWDLGEHHRELVRSIARDLPEDDGWKSFKKRALSATGVTGIARLAQSDARLTVHIDHLDANPYELNTPGGIIDLRTGTLRPADPDALHTRTTATAPDFENPSPLLKQFLSTTFGGDTELITYVQRLLGMSAIGTVLEQVLPFAHGSGANGKSTLYEAVMHALGRGEGGYAISAPSEMLMVRKHSEHPAELAQLAGARLVVCSELEDGARFAEARIKQLTGRDSINARFMRRDPFTFTPSHTFALLGNHKPDTGAGGPAFWRRLQLIPFEHVVPEKERDASLGERLESEAPAILAWLAEGAAAYIKNGLGTPEAVREATADYAHDQDSVGRFVEDSCNRVGRTTVKAIREAYERWCSDEGVAPVSARRLTQELRRFGVESAKGAKGARVYDGIGLTSATLGVADEVNDGDRGGW